MRWLERQQKIEEAVYDVMDELSDILSIPIRQYPEVWWLGRSVRFEDLLLPESLRDEIEKRQRLGISSCLGTRQIVIIARKSTPHTIMEEAAHAFHYISSGIDYKNRNMANLNCLATIAEMFGFLGARLVGSDAKNYYEAIVDLAILTPESRATLRNRLSEMLGDKFDFNEFFFHQQGYGLADRIYFKYLSGEVSLARLRGMFLAKLTGRNEALKCFVELRNEFWPRILPQATT